MFFQAFDTEAHWKLLKELFIQVNLGQLNKHVHVNLSYQ